MHPISPITQQPSTPKAFDTLSEKPQASWGEYAQRLGELLSRFFQIFKTASQDFVKKLGIEASMTGPFNLEFHWRRPVPTPVNTDIKLPAADPNQLQYFGAAIHALIPTSKDAAWNAKQQMIAEAGSLTIKDWNLEETQSILNLVQDKTRDLVDSAHSLDLTHAEKMAIAGWLKQDHQELNTKRLTYFLAIRTLVSRYGVTRSEIANSPLQLDVTDSVQTHPENQKLGQDHELIQSIDEFLELINLRIRFARLQDMIPDSVQADASAIYQHFNALSKKAEIGDADTKEILEEARLKKERLEINLIALGLSVDDGSFIIESARARQEGKLNLSQLERTFNLLYEWSGHANFANFAEADFTKFQTLYQYFATCEVWAELNRNSSAAVNPIRGIQQQSDSASDLDAMIQKLIRFADNLFPYSLREAIAYRSAKQAGNPFNQSGWSAEEAQSIRDLVAARVNGSNEVQPIPLSGIESLNLNESEKVAIQGWLKENNYALNVERLSYLFTLLVLLIVYGISPKDDAPRLEELAGSTDPFPRPHALGLNPKISIGSDLRSEPLLANSGPSVFIRLSNLHFKVVLLLKHMPESVQKEIKDFGDYSRKLDASALKAEQSTLEKPAQLSPSDVLFLTGTQFDYQNVDHMEKFITLLLKALKATNFDTNSERFKSVHKYFILANQARELKVK